MFSKCGIVMLGVVSSFEIHVAIVSRVCVSFTKYIVAVALPALFPTALLFTFLRGRTPVCLARADNAHRAS